MKPVIAVTTGDPFGIGPEVALRAAAHPSVLEVCRPLLIGDRAHLIGVGKTLAGGPAPPGGPAAPAGDPSGWPEVSQSPLGWGSKQGDDILVRPWPDGPALHDMGDRPERPPSPGPSAS